MEEMTKHGEVGLAAMRAGVDRKTAVVYNGHDQPVQVTTPDGRTTTLQYNSGKRLTVVRNAVGEELRYELSPDSLSGRRRSNRAVPIWNGTAPSAQPQGEFSVQYAMDSLQRTRNVSGNNGQSETLVLIETSSGFGKTISIPGPLLE